METKMMSSKLSFLMFSLVLLSMAVAITQQRECHKWEYQCTNNFGCCNCLMCPKKSGCSPTVTDIVPECEKNIQKTSYESCSYIAHCGWTEQMATLPTCPPIATQDAVTIKYISPDAYFQYERVQNHLFAEARIVCADGTNSTVVKCLPGGTDGTGGKWNRSTSLTCSKDHGADVVSTPPNQKLSTPSMKASTEDQPKQKSPMPTPTVIATKNDTLHIKPTYDIQSNISGTNITVLATNKTDTGDSTSAEIGGFPVYAIYICVIGGTALLVVIILILCCPNCRKQHNDNQGESTDDDPKPADPLLTDESQEGTTIVEMPDTDCDVSRNNNHASENGQCALNGGLRTPNGDIPSRKPVATQNRLPEQSNEESLRLECIEMQTAVDNPTMTRNLDTDLKEIRPKVMPNNQTELSPLSPVNSHLPPQQAHHDVDESTCSDIPSCHCPVAVVNPLSQTKARKRPVEQDERNIPGSQSSLSTAGSDSDNQASTSQTNVKELFDSGQDQGVGEVHGSDEGESTLEDLSKAEPVNHRNDGQGYYTGTGSPEEVNTAVTEEVVDSPANHLEFAMTGPASDPAPDSVAPRSAIQNRTEEEGVLHGASGGPSCEHGNLAGRNNDQYGDQDRAEETNCRYNPNPEREQLCRLTFKEISKRNIFQEFILSVAKFTDHWEEPWRLLARYVCEVDDGLTLDHFGYKFLKSQASMGVGGNVLYEYALNLGRHKKLYRLVHFIGYCDGVKERFQFLKLVVAFFPEHFNPDNTEHFCAACNEILWSLLPPNHHNDS